MPNRYTSPMPEPGLLVAVLAAGASRRLGRAKQLVEIDGEPLLRRQCRIALHAGIGPVVAILGCQLRACAATIADLPVPVSENEQWPEGLASSIRLATRTAIDAHAAGLLILHGDQYRVTAHDLRTLHIAWQAAGGTKACRARHEDYVGPPVVLPTTCFPAALQLSGEDGARGVLSALGPGAVIDVAMPNAAHDLDLPAQLADLVGGGFPNGHLG